MLDLFSGIGGLSLGLERAGMKTVALCEIGKKQQSVLRKHFPGVPIFDDATATDVIVSGLGMHPDVIAGGDPCPIRSRARSNGKSRHPDLSGYFLALVGRLRPKWVVRENVLASDDVDFATALGVLGYRTNVVRANSFPLTGQNRARDFVVGGADRCAFVRFFGLFEQQSGPWIDPKGNPESEGYPCLTTHRKRYDARDGYIWDGERLRVADSSEREKLAGFPPGWLEGLSETACARVCGNAVVPGVAEVIGRAIVAAEEHRRG